MEKKAQQEESKTLLVLQRIDDPFLTFYCNETRDAGISTWAKSDHGNLRTLGPIGVK